MWTHTIDWCYIVVVYNLAQPSHLSMASLVPHACNCLHRNVTESKLLYITPGYSKHVLLIISWFFIAVIAITLECWMIHSPTIPLWWGFLCSSYCVCILCACRIFHRWRKIFQFSEALQPRIAPCMCLWHHRTMAADSRWWLTVKFFLRSAFMVVQEKFKHLWSFVTN